MVIETKASMILQFIDGLRGDVHVTFEEGTSAAWLYESGPGHVANKTTLGLHSVKSFRVSVWCGYFPRKTFLRMSGQNSWKT